MTHLLHYRYTLLSLLLVLALPLFVRSGSLATELLIFALAAVACNLLLGYTGLMSFGQGIFFGLGSYASGWLLLHVQASMALALSGSVVIGALGAALVGWFAIRQRGVYFVMLTLAFAQMFYFLAYTMVDVTGGDNGLMDIPRPAPFGLGQAVDVSTPWGYYMLVALLFLGAFVCMQHVVDSRFGRTLLAIRDNEARAAAVGYDVRAFKLLAFVLSGAVTGLAGGLHAMLAGIAPLSSIEYHISESILLMTVIGGAGNLFASVLGAAAYVLTADALAAIWPRWMMLLGFLLMAVTLYMQRGLWGVIVKAGDRLRAGRRAGRADAAEAQGEQA